MNNRKKSIGVLEAFALSIGTSIGWGSFVVILEGSDYDRREELVSILKDTSRRNAATDDGVVIATGFAIHQAGDKFQDVFHRADELMYANKNELKKLRPYHSLR